MASAYTTRGKQILDKLALMVVDIEPSDPQGNRSDS